MCLVFATISIAQQTNEIIPMAVKTAPVVFRNRHLYTAQTNQYSTTEVAVMRCLRWFKRTQNTDGSWGDETEPKPLATAIALQAFLKHGESPSSDEFGSTVDRGLKFLLSGKEEGKLTQGTTARAIEHGICAFTLCEAYGMTRRPEILPAAKNAISAILAAQRSSGLWHTAYEREQGNDDLETSVWQILALKSSIFAGVADDNVRPALKKGAEAMRMFVQDDSKKSDVGPAVLSFQIAGLYGDSAYRVGIASIAGLTMNWEKPEFGNPVFEWYCITQAKFHQGGRMWAEWNKILKPTLVKMQTIQTEAIEGRRKGNIEDIGYWLSPGMNERFGKVYSSALCCMMLGVYYAWLPTYSHEPIETVPKEDKEIRIDVK